MITPELAAILAALGGKTSAVLLGIYLGGRLLMLLWRGLMIGLATGVAILDSDKDRRADALKVLKRLEPSRRHLWLWSRAPKTLPPPDGDEQPPEQVASAQQTDRVRPKRHG
jgi:hypothetical protein